MGQEQEPSSLSRYGMVTESELDPRLKGLLRYWEVKRAGRRFPARADIDPLELKSVLGNIVMVDVVPQENGEVRFRVCSVPSSFSITAPI
jgi:hypothetical protein